MKRGTLPRLDNSSVKETTPPKEQCDLDDTLVPSSTPNVAATSAPSVSKESILHENVNKLESAPGFATSDSS